jgi:acetylornithine deacetylase
MIKILREAMMNDHVLKVLRDLIAIDSVNPSLVPGGAGESQIAEAVARELRSFSLDVKIQEVAPRRPNVIGVLEGRNKGKSLMLCGHLDTVGVAGMKAPFDPVQREGRIYGRGSQDMKGGVAAMMCAATALSSKWKSGRLIVAGVADEEYASIGASALVKDYCADAAIVLEPSDLQIGLAHKGFAWIEITTTGRAAHGSRPLEGRDAILRMGRVLSHLEKLEARLKSKSPHPLLGNGSMHASLIDGGRELSTYPDHCVLKMERRLLTEETAGTALSEVQEILAHLRADDPEFQADARFLFGQPAYALPENHILPELIEAALKKNGKTTKRSGMTFWTDAAILGEARIPSVVFGPGGAGLHGLEEYVLADEVLACQTAVMDVASTFCAG